MLENRKQKIMELGFSFVTLICLVCGAYGYRVGQPILIFFSAWIMIYVIYGVRINDSRE